MTSFLKNNSIRIHGFTLIEVMITVAIVSLLVTIAVPSYSEYVTRSKRSEGQRELLRLASLMEQRFLDARAYTEDLTLLGLPNASYYTTVEGGYYSIKSTTSANDTAFTLTATAQGAHATSDADCEWLSIDDTGARQAKNADCWEN